MKKTTQQQMRKPVAVKRQQASELAKEDPHEIKKKEKQQDPVLRSNTRATIKKPAVPANSKREEKNHNSISKQRKSVSAAAAPLKAKRPVQTPTTSKTGPATKKPVPGSFNVTVFSPPSTRKAPDSTGENPSTTVTRDRTRTRTLKPEEVTILNKISEIPNITSNEKPKVPVSFDINFIKNSNTKSVSSAKKAVENAGDDEIDEDRYESEFESYESDFESGSSKKSLSSSSSSATSKTSDLNSGSDSSSSDSDASSSLNEVAGKVPHINEQKLDSGNYDMKSKRVLVPNDFIVNPVNRQEDNQPDSGMNSGLFETHQTVSSMKLLQQRHTDILAKITLNTMNFEFYEDQPAPYEYFVTNYGRVKGVQNHSQTETEAITSQTQTDTIYYRSSWVQNPPQFSKESLLNMNVINGRYLEEKLGVGQEEFYGENCIAQQADVFSNFLQNLETSKAGKLEIRKQSHKLFANFNDIRKFLRKSSVAVESALNQKRSKAEKHPTSKTINIKQHKVLSNSVVISAYSDSNLRHVLITLHECHLGTAHHRYVICVWDNRNCSSPEAILSCWGNVTCTERVGSTVIAGTANGTLCLWDVEGSEEETPPLQLVTPELSKDLMKHHYGGIVAVKTTRHSNSLKDLAIDQVLTLFEAGVLVTWVLSLLDQEPDESGDQHLNTTFHNAKFRLAQQNVLKLISIPKRSLSVVAPVSSNHFKKGSLEDLLATKNNGTDDCSNDEFTFFSDMLVYRNKAIISSNTRLTVVNHLEQKCELLFKNQSLITTFKQHPEMKEYIFTLSSENTIKIIKIVKEGNTKMRENAAKVHDAKQHCASFNSKLSPVLNNKSCAIQNIVKNERVLYQDASGHTDGLTRPMSTNVDNDSLVNNQSQLIGTEMIPFHHNQTLFLKHVGHRNSSIFFLDRGRIVCVGAENGANLIDLKTGRETHLSDYITTDFNNHRLLGTVDKQVVP